MSIQKIGPVRGSLQAGNVTVTYVPATGWMPGLGWRTAQALLVLMVAAGNFEVAPAYQTATTDITSPDAWATLETTAQYLSSGGTKDATAVVVDLSSALDGKFWVRFGFAVKVSSTGFGRGDVEATFVGCA